MTDFDNSTRTGGDSTSHLAALQTEQSRSGLLSCVVGTAPRFLPEVLRWFATATECAGISADRLIAHVVGRSDSDVLRFIAAKGVHVVPIDPFDERSKHCNKIAGAEALANSMNGESVTVALMDTDMLVMADPTELAPPQGSVAGKRVDLANPSLRVLAHVFREAGVDATPALPPPEPTLLGNLNGGLYVLHGSNLPAIASTWSKWAHWLLDRPSLLGESAVHVDQVAFCLASAALGLKTELLEESWNLPTHLDRKLPRDTRAPKLIHYHRCVDSAGLVQPTGHPMVDESISRANLAVAKIASELGRGSSARVSA